MGQQYIYIYLAICIVMCSEIQVCLYTILNNTTNYIVHNCLYNINLSIQSSHVVGNLLLQQLLGSSSNREYRQPELRTSSSEPPNRYKMIYIYIYKYVHTFLARMAKVIKCTPYVDMFKSQIPFMIDSNRFNRQLNPCGTPKKWFTFSKPIPLSQ